MAQVNLFDEKQWVEMARQAHFACKQLCSALSVSQRQLERYTRQTFGCSPRNWLNTEKLKLAGILLVESQSAKVVCFELGFKQPSHFSREFKRYYGVSPSDYLMKHEGRDKKDIKGKSQMQLDFHFMSSSDNRMSGLDK